MEVHHPVCILALGSGQRLLYRLTQLTTPKEEWINKRKEAKKLIYIPDSLINSLDVS